MAKLMGKGAWKLHISTLAVLGCLAVFLILLCVRVDGGGGISYIYVLIPWFITLLLLCYICELTINSSARSSLEFAKNLTRLFTFVILALIASGSALLALKADNTLDLSWSVAFAPIWAALVLYAVTLALLFPGLIDPTIKLHRVAFLGTVYLCTAALVSVFTALHLELDIPPNWTLVFIPLWVCATLHAFSLLCLNPKSKTDNALGPWGLELLALLMAVLAAVLLNIRKDVGGVPASVVGIPIWGLLGVAGIREMADFWSSDSYVDL